LRKDVEDSKNIRHSESRRELRFRKGRRTLMLKRGGIGGRD
jgi:hypothetical protein